MVRGHGFQLDWNGPAITAAITRAALNALEDTGEELLRRANETVPYDDGVLAASGEVEIKPASLTVTVSYNTPYAVRQHEDTTLRHPNPLSPSSSPRGRARWLELTAKEERSDLAAHLARNLDGGIV